LAALLFILKYPIPVSSEKLVSENDSPPVYCWYDFIFPLTF
jgi:hypothetical protein